MTLPGPSRTIIVEPIEQPATEPRPEREPAPERTPEPIPKTEPIPEREKEKEPA